MQKKKAPSLFLILLIVSLLLVFLSKTGMFANAANLFSPFRHLATNITQVFVQVDNKSENELIKKENRELVKKLTKLKELEKDNKAFRDQFQNGDTPKESLLPAKIIGMPGFIPGKSVPEYFIIDKGGKDTIEKGMFVIAENNLVGQIDVVSENSAKVMLVTKTGSTFTVSVIKKDGEASEVTGIVKSSNNNLLLDNVLLSDEIKKEDIVVTKGDKDEKGNGVLPGLIMGKIIAVNKNPSALFQTAQVKSFLDFSKLTTVFVITQ